MPKPIHLCLLIVFLTLSACARPQVAQPHSNTEPPAVEAQAPSAPDTLPLLPKPLAITDMSFMEGVRWDDTWTLLPFKQVEVRITATGARNVQLSVNRYPSSPDVTPQQPDRVEGDVYIFDIDISQLAHYLVFEAQADGEGAKSVREYRKVFALNQKYQNFTTIAKGTATGWAPSQESEIRALFQEGQVLWFDDAAKFTAFAEKLKALVGVTVSIPALNGQTVMAVLGAPTNGVRRFEVVHLKAMSGAKGSIPVAPVDLDLAYDAQPTLPGPTVISYHIIMADLSAYKRPGEVTVSLTNLPVGGIFAVRKLNIDQ